MRFQLIEEHGCEFPITRLCQVLDVSSRGRRACRSSPASRRQRSDMIVLARIKEQSRLSLGSYGRTGMTEALKEIGLNVGPRRGGRLRRENGIGVERSKRYTVTTDCNHAFNNAPNLLNRDVRAGHPNRNGAGDISHVWTREGWSYLAVILNLHSRRGIGRAVGTGMTRDLAIRALKMAVALRQPTKGCIHHTDRGSQYSSSDHQRLLRQHGVLNSSLRYAVKASVTAAPQLRQSSRETRLSWSGDDLGKHEGRLKWQTSNE